MPILAGFNQGEIRSLAHARAARARRCARPTRRRSARATATLADAFLALYPAATYRESILATTRDALYGWTVRAPRARARPRRGQPSYLYLFDHGYPAMDEAGLHAFHASELPYMFGTLDRTGPLWPRIPDTRRETALSDAMVGYWTSFAATGVPDGARRARLAAASQDVAIGYALRRCAPRRAETARRDVRRSTRTVVRRRRAAGIAWNWNVGLAAPLCCETPPR